MRVLDLRRFHSNFVAGAEGNGSMRPDARHAMVCAWEVDHPCKTATQFLRRQFPQHLLCPCVEAESNQLEDIDSFCPDR